MGHSYEFKIVLDQPKKCFGPGDRVTGNVDLEIAKSMTIKEIVVLIRGVAESANYQYVSQWNPMTRRHERRKISKTIRYDLFSYAVKVFPPPNLQQFGMAEEYTMAEGHYNYPFELKFPDGPVEARTTSHADVSNSYMDASYMLLPSMGQTRLNSSGVTTLALPPAFDLYKDYDDHATVRYTVEAFADRKGFMKSDLGCVERLRFSPPLDSVMCSFSQLLGMDGFIPNFDGTSSKLSFLIDKSKRREGKSFFKKMFASRSLKVPFEAVLEFKESNAAQYPQGQTSRVLHQGDILADVVRIKLITPFSRDALQLILLHEEGKKSEPVALSRLIFKEISLSFTQIINYQGIEEMQSRRDVQVEKRGYKNEFEFSDFEEVPHWSLGLLKHVKQEHSQFVESGKAYMFEVPPEMLSIPLKTDAQSFTAPNIRCDIRLKVNIVLTTTDPTPEVCRLICDTPILLLPPRASGGTSVAYAPPSVPPPTSMPSVPVSNGNAQDKHDESLPLYSEVK